MTLLIIGKKCSLCGNKSGYDIESLKGSTHEINGNSLIICCGCEDDLTRMVRDNKLIDYLEEREAEDLNEN